MQIAGAMACSGINAASHCKHPNSLSKLFFFLSFFLSPPLPIPHRCSIPNGVFSSLYPLFIYIVGSSRPAPARQRAVPTCLTSVSPGGDCREQPFGDGEGKKRSQPGASSCTALPAA